MDSYVWGLGILTLRVFFSYVLGFVFLRLGSGILTFGVRDSYVSELVF